MKLSSDNTFNCAAAGKLTWFPMPTALNRTISPLRNVIWPWAVPVITSSTAGFHAYLSVPANLATIPAIRPVPLHSPSKSTSATNPFSPTSVILRVMVLVWSSQSIAPKGICNLPLNRRSYTARRMSKRRDTISVTQSAELLSRYGSDAPRPAAPASRTRR